MDVAFPPPELIPVLLVAAVVVALVIAYVAMTRSDGR